MKIAASPGTITAILWVALWVFSTLLTIAASVLGRPSIWVGYLDVFIAAVLVLSAAWLHSIKVEGSGLTPAQALAVLKTLSFSMPLLAVLYQLNGARIPRSSPST